MRWFWIDKFIEFESGKSAKAVKNVSLAEEHLHDHFAGFPMMPHSLVIEGFAQTGGLLVGEHTRYEERVVLAKISKARFHGFALPGDTLVYSVRVEDIQPDGSFVSGTSHIGDRLHAEVDLVFAHLDKSSGDRLLFVPSDFIALLRSLAIYDVGRGPDGNALEVPDYLLEAERIANAEGVFET